MTTLILVRHGETVWHAENRYAGSSDVALTERGRAQANDLAEWAASVKLDRVVSSDLVRAVDTATPSAVAAGVKLSIDPGLREVDFGQGEGMTTAEMREMFPAALAAFHQAPASNSLPNAESGVVALARAEKVLAALVADGPGATILVVAHSTLLRLVLCSALGVKLDEYRRTFPEMKNVALTTIARTGGQSALLGFNVPIARIAPL